MVDKNNMYDEIEYETPFEGTPDKPITYRDPLTKIIDTRTEATNFADEIGPIPKTLEGGMRSLELDQEQKQKVIDEKKGIDAFNVETGVEEQRIEAERRLAIDAQEAREDMEKARERSAKLTFIPFTLTFGTKKDGLYDRVVWKRYGLNEEGERITLDTHVFKNMSENAISVGVNDRNRFYDNLGIKTKGKKYAKGKTNLDVVPYLVNTDIGYAATKFGGMIAGGTAWALSNLTEQALSIPEGFYRKEKNLIIPTSKVDKIPAINLIPGTAYIKDVVFDYPGIESLVGPNTNNKILNFFEDIKEKIDIFQEQDIAALLLDYANKGVYKYAHFIVPEDQRDGIVQPNNWVREDFENMLHPENAEFNRDWAGFLGENLGGFKIFQMVTKTGRKASVEFFERLGLDAAADLLSKKNVNLLPKKYRDYSPMQLWKTKELYPQLAQRAINMHRLKVDAQTRNRLLNVGDKLKNLGASMRIEAATEPGRLYVMLYGSETAGSWASALADHRFDIARETPLNTLIEIGATLTAPSIVQAGVKAFEKPTIFTLDKLTFASDAVGNLYSGRVFKDGAPGDSMFKLISNYLQTGSVDMSIDSVRIPTSKSGEFRPLTPKEKDTMFKFVQAMNNDPENKIAALQHIRYFMQAKDEMIALGVPEEEITPLLADVIKLSYMQDATAHMMNANNLGFKVRNQRKIRTNMKWIETYSNQLKSQNQLSNRLVQKFDEIVNQYGVSGKEYERINDLVIKRTTNMQGMFNSVEKSLNEAGDAIVAKIALGDVEGLRSSAEIIAAGDELTSFIKELDKLPINADEISKKATDVFESRAGREIDESEFATLEAGQQILGTNTTNINATTLALDALDVQLTKLAKGGGSDVFIATNQKANISDSWGALIHKTSNELRDTADKMSQIRGPDGELIKIDGIRLVEDLDKVLSDVSPAQRYGMDKVLMQSKIDTLLEESWGSSIRNVNNKFYRQVVLSKGLVDPSDAEEMRKAIDVVRKNLVRKVAKQKGIQPEQVNETKVFMYLAENKEKIAAKGEDFSFFNKAGTFTLDLDVSDFYSILQTTLRKQRDMTKSGSGTPPTEIAFIDAVAATLNRYETKHLGNLAEDAQKQYDLFREWYKDTAVPFRHQNSHVKNVYRFEGIDRTGKSVTGIYHGDGNTTSQWLGKFVNSHLGQDGSGRTLVDDLDSMFPNKIKNELGELVINPDRELAEKLLMRHLAVTVREGAVENHQKLLKMGDLTDTDLDKYLANPKPFTIVNKQFDELIESLDEVTNGRISFKTLKEYKIKRNDSIKFIEENVEAYKDGAKAVKSTTSKVKNEVNLVKDAVKTVQDRANRSGQKFGDLVENLKANPIEFFDSIVKNPNELIKFKKWATSSGAATEEVFNEMIGIQLARGLSRKIRTRSPREALMTRPATDDIDITDIQMKNLLDDSKLAALSGEEGLDKISFNEVMKILDNPNTVELLEEYLPINFKKMKVIFRGLTYTRRPVRTGLNTSTDRSPSLDTAGLSSRGNALAQDRTGIRYQTAEMLMTLFLRSEIDTVAGLFLNKEAVDVLTDLVVRGRMPPTKWTISYKNKTGIWLPELIALADQLGIYEQYIERDTDKEVYY